MSIRVLKEYLRLIAEEAMIDEDEDEEEGQSNDEIATVAAVAGYTGPLGYTPKVAGKKKGSEKKRKKPHWSPTASSFAGAKPVK